MHATLAAKRHEKKPLRNRWRSWEDNIKMYPTEKDYRPVMIYL
jgi:hypothetical protein